MASPAQGALFLAGVAAAVAVVVWCGVAAVRRRSQRTPLNALAGVVLAYAFLLALGAALSVERRVPLGTTLCFDDWCAAVAGVRIAPGPDAAHEIVVARMRVSSTARRVTQRGSDPHVYVIDAAGAWFRADRAVGASPSLLTPVAPGESFTTEVGAAVPAGASIAALRLWEGAWIDDFVPFDEESPFHRKTFYDVHPPR